MHAQVEVQRVLREAVGEVLRGRQVPRHRRALLAKEAAQTRAEGHRRLSARAGRALPNCLAIYCQT